MFKQRKIFIFFFLFIFSFFDIKSQETNLKGLSKIELKEIINEELQREMAHAPGEPDYSVSADSEEVADIEADLRAARGKLRMFPEDPRILDMIARLEELLVDLKS